jgi:hypothetical protein
MVPKVLTRLMGSPQAKVRAVYHLDVSTLLWSMAVIWKCSLGTDTEVALEGNLGSVNHAGCSRRFDQLPYTLAQFPYI